MRLSILVISRTPSLLSSLLASLAGATDLPGLEVEILCSWNGSKESETEIDNHRLRKALEMARLEELVEELPQKAETMIGERGIRLSGGQRQRVALARAFYHQRDVLVMDESTSSLDHETEREIVEEIKRLKGQVTVIVIAHRKTTVQHCDRIYRLE
mgnify:CR=1 FL=1